MIKSPFHALSPYARGAKKVGRGEKEFQDFAINQSGRPRGVGPESGMAVPHVLSAIAVIGSGWQTYWHGDYDEALRDSMANADAMRNDPFIRRLVNENKDAVCSLKWSVEVDNVRDPWQKALKDGLTQIYRNTPYAEDLNQYLMEAIWYGRYGAQFSWKYKMMDLPALPKGGGLAGNPFLPGGAQSLGGIQQAEMAGTPSVGPQGSLAGLSNPGSTREKRKALCIDWHIPYEGDKIGYDYSGCPYVLINTGAVTKSWETQGAEIGNIPPINAKNMEYGYTTAGGRALFLRTPSWRQRFAIHRGDILDSPFYNAEAGDAIHGIGIRSVIYWYWWLRDEFLSNVSDWCARTGLGVRIWYYDSGNESSYQKVSQAARQQSDKTNILMPREPGSTESQVEFVDTSGSGAELLLRMVQYLDEQIVLYVTGRNTGRNESTGEAGGSDRDQSTKYQITRRNAAKFSDTCTYDILDVMKRWSFPKEMQEIPARLVYHADTPDPDEYMKGVTSFCELGGTVPEAHVAGVLGIPSPHEGDRVLGGQQPLPPGIGGGGVGTEEETPAVGGDNDAPNDHNNEPGKKKPGQRGVGGGIFQGDGSVQPVGALKDAVQTAGKFRMEHAEEVDKSRYSWITIGGKAEGDEKHVGGFHVEIDGDGKIIRGGTTAMHGKPVHEVGKVFDEMEKKEPEPEPEQPKPAEKPAEKPPEKPPEAEQPSLDNLSNDEKISEKKPAVRSAEEARRLFDDPRVLPKSELFGYPQVAEQWASKFAKGDRYKWDELCQVAAKKIYELLLSTPDIKEDGTFEGLANTAAKNAITDYLRRQGSGINRKMRQVGEKPSGDQADIDQGQQVGAEGLRAPAQESPAKIAETNEQSTGIHKAIASMEPREQELAKGLMGGESGPDIMRRLGISKATLSRAMEKLRTALSEFRDKDEYCLQLDGKIRYALAEMEEHTRYVKQSVDNVVAEIQEEKARYEREQAEKVRYESKLQREEAEAKEQAAEQRLFVMLERLKPAPQPALDLVALAKLLRDTMPVPAPVPPPLDIVELARLLKEMMPAPQERPKSITITKGKDGKYKAEAD